jgi:hypothetical protein
VKSIDVYALGNKYFEKVKSYSISKIFSMTTLKAKSSVVGLIHRANARAFFSIFAVKLS